MSWHWHPHPNVEEGDAAPVVSARELLRRGGESGAVEALAASRSTLVLRLEAALSHQGVAFTVPGSLLPVFVAVAVVSGLVAAIASARRASRLDPLQALQYE
jgi:hypothetical protein